MADGLRLNLGCGERHFEGFINVDKFGSPDLRLDLETFPWPWQENTVTEIWMIHVLEHLGQTPEIYLSIIKEIYRICRNGALLSIIVPHYRHQYYFDDPTHIRAITPLGMQLFSQRLNQQWIQAGSANSPLGIYLGVNFELKNVAYKPSQDWFRLHPEQPIDTDVLERESNLYNNLIEEIHMTIEILK